MGGATPRAPARHAEPRANLAHRQRGQPLDALSHDEQMDIVDSPGPGGGKHERRLQEWIGDGRDSAQFAPTPSGRTGKDRRSGGVRVASSRASRPLPASADHAMNIPAISPLDTGLRCSADGWTPVATSAGALS